MTNFKANYDLFRATSKESFGTLAEETIGGIADWVAHNNLPTEDLDRAAFFAAVGQEVITALKVKLAGYREDYEASREEEAHADTMAARHWNPNKEEIH
jgi:hypothetical protein|tara:strand:- start:430 stop:726 length:297 start_codon:yes stop_codon:yes gene_type:complete